MSFSLDCSDDEFSPTVSEIATREAQPHVRKEQQALEAMSDAELQAYIHECAEQLLSANKQWEATGCFGWAGERDAWWKAEAAALRERGNRPHIVSRMEQERGLA